MRQQQAKSDCCKAKIIKYGNRRRQCVLCKKTWSIRKKKVGRKNIRLNEKYLEFVFDDNMLVKNIKKLSVLSKKNIYKKFDKLIKSFVSKRKVEEIGKGKLIFIIDAKWKYFKDKQTRKRVLWTMYSIVVKQTNSNNATILDPVLLKGKESSKTWLEIFEEKVPKSLKNKGCVLVSDSLRGIEKLAKQNNWIHQRCNFHILQELQKRVGKRKSTRGRNVRQEIYKIIDEFLQTDSNKKFSELKLLAKNKDCPKSMRMTVNEFMRRSDDFTAYLKFPKLNIPRTSSVLESLHSLYGGKTSKVKTPESWHRWCVAIARFKKEMEMKK